MELTEAIDLISPGIVGNVDGQRWADLGCGAGLFTKALATLLGRGSHIYAVDIEEQYIENEEGLGAIEFIKKDFLHHSLPFSSLNGILMANSLHYVKDKDSFIKTLKHSVVSDGRIVIIEYDATRANTWVPYPIAFDQLARLFAAHGFSKTAKIGERKSIFRADKMYACVIERG
jgi:ubiquinone/menaquinone biosynthesis C-methylase UbiE